VKLDYKWHQHRGQTFLTAIEAVRPETLGLTGNWYLCSVYGSLAEGDLASIGSA
jgi:hypothetical protein